MTIDNSSPYERNSSIVEAFGRNIPNFKPDHKMNLFSKNTVEAKPQVVPPKYKHTDEYHENDSKDEMKNEEMTEEVNDDSDYDIVIESVSYV